MAVWTGWLADVLDGIGAPDTDANRRFLTEWESSERTTCAFNPLSVRVTGAGSSRCKELSNGLYAQAYTTKAHGLAATLAQFDQPNHAAIKAVLVTGDPFLTADPQQVVTELGYWAAHTFATKYAGQATTAATTPPPPPTGGDFADIAYLEGGPCDGTTQRLPITNLNSYTITCKGGLYKQPNPPRNHGRDIVFAYAGKAASGSVKAPQALGGWKALRKSINRGMPEALSYSQHVTTAALRTLSKSRKVRL